MGERVIQVEAVLSKTSGDLSIPMKAAQRKREQFAGRLDDLLQKMHLAKYLPCAGGLQMPNVPDAVARDARVALLTEIGGAQSSKTNQLRIFLEKYGTWWATVYRFDPFSPPGCVPFLVANVMEWRAWARDKGGMATCADSVSAAWETMEMLQIPTLGSSKTLEINRLKRRVGGSGEVESNARDCPPPRLLYDMEMAVWREGAGIDVNMTPQHWYIALAWLDVKLGCRGISVSDGVFKPMKPSDKEMTLVFTDKSGRVATELYAPLGGFYVGNMLGERQFINVLAELGFNTPMWTRIDNPKSFPGGLGYTAMQSIEWALQEDGTMQFDPKPHSLASIAAVVPFVSGKSFEDLKEMKLSGTHLWRHFGVLISTLGRHGVMANDIAGDWAPSNETLEKHIRLKGRKKSTAKTYQQQWTKKEQVKTRKRIMDLVRAALICRCRSILPTFTPPGAGRDAILNGADSWLPWSVTWPEVIPKSLEEGSPLTEFVGETSMW